LAKVTAQFLLSNAIVYFVMSVCKFIPVKESYVPPFTVPYLGYIEVIAAVNVLVKVTLLGA
jgi:hypothetical protein